MLSSESRTVAQIAIVGQMSRASRFSPQSFGNTAGAHFLDFGLRRLPLICSNATMAKGAGF
jgi:hypothetical protein